MKKIIPFICALAMTVCTAFTAPAQKTVTNTLSVGQFTKIDVGTGMNVTFRQGAYAPIKIIGPSETLKRISVTTKGQKIRIEYKKQLSNNRNSGEVRIEVQAPDVREFDLGTGAALNVPSGISTMGNVEIDLSTGAVANVSGLKAGNVDIDLSTGAVANVSKINAGQVDIDASTGAQATLGGKCSYLEIDTSTGAVVNAAKLVSAAAKVDASVGAQVDYNSKGTVKVSTSLGAEVRNHAK